MDRVYCRSDIVYNELNLKIKFVYFSKRLLKKAFNKSLKDEWKYRISAFLIPMPIGGNYYISAYSVATKNLIITKEYLNNILS